MDSGNSLEINRLLGFQDLWFYMALLHQNISSIKTVWISYMKYHMKSGNVVLQYGIIFAIKSFSFDGNQMPVLRCTFVICDKMLWLSLGQLSDFTHCMDGMSYDSWLWKQL